MDADKFIKKAVKSEKKRLKDNAELKKEQQKIESSLDDVPSRVRIDAGNELIIEPIPFLKSFSRFVSSEVSTDFFAVLVAGTIFYFSFMSSMGYSFSSDKDMIVVLGIYLLAVCSICIWIAVKITKIIPPLNKPFHLNVSGNNFIVHSGNIEDYIAAPTKVDSDGDWNIMAEINEEDRLLSITWVYGPDINNKETGSQEYSRQSNPDKQSHLNLRDIRLIRKFLLDNGIEIYSDRRINE